MQAPVVHGENKRVATRDAQHVTATRVPDRCGPLIPASRAPAKHDRATERRSTERQSGARQSGTRVKGWVRTAPSLHHRVDTAHLQDWRLSEGLHLRATCGEIHADGGPGVAILVSRSHSTNSQFPLSAPGIKTNSPGMAPTITRPYLAAVLTSRRG